LNYVLLFVYLLSVQYWNQGDDQSEHLWVGYCNSCVLRMYPDEEGGYHKFLCSENVFNESRKGNE